MSTDSKGSRKARRLFGLWFLSFSFIACYAAWGWSQERRGDLLYYIFLLPLALATRDFVSVSLPSVLLWAALGYASVGIVLGSFLGRTRVLNDDSAFWVRYKWATALAPVGGFLFLASLLLSILSDSAATVLLNISFLPLYPLYYVFPKAPAWAHWILSLILIPTCYAVVGLVVDAIRLRTRARERKGPAGPDLGSRSRERR